MRGISAACIIVTVALAGCAVRYSAGERASAQGINTTSQVSVASGSALGNAIIVGVMLADGVHYYRLGRTARPRSGHPKPIRHARSTSRIARVRLIRMR